MPQCTFAVLYQALLIQDVQLATETVHTVCTEIPGIHYTIFLFFSFLLSFIPNNDLCEGAEVKNHKNKSFIEALLKKNNLEKVCGSSEDLQAHNALRDCRSAISTIQDYHNYDTTIGIMSDN